MITPLFDEAEGVVVKDDRSADWAVRKIAEIRKERDRLISATEAVIAEYQEKIEDVKRKAESDEAFFNSELLRYMERVPGKETKTQKTYALPSGRLVIKRRAPEVKRDAEVLLPFAKQIGLVKVVETPEWDEIKKGCDLSGADCIYARTGEIVPGVTLIPRPDEFIVEVDARV